MAKKPAPKSKSQPRASGQNGRSGAAPLKAQTANPQQRTYDMPDWRAERPEFRIEQVREGENVKYVVHGDLSAPPPPIRESTYLSREQHIALYRWMLLNRRMETAL